MKKDDHDGGRDLTISDHEGETAGPPVDSPHQLLSPFAAIVDSIDHAIVGSTLDGIITCWNTAAARVYGYAASEAIGSHLSLILPEDQGSELSSTLARAAAGERIGDREMQHRRKDGAVVDVSMSLSPVVDSAGLVTGIGAVIRETRASDASGLGSGASGGWFGESECLERLGQLVGGIAHQFNNLLCVILNYADFVAGELDDPRTARADLTRIREAAERASEFTRQLITFAGRGLHQPRVIDLNEMVRRLIPPLQHSIGGRIEVITTLAKDLSPVSADPDWLEQALMNLVLNATDAMPEGGRLIIDTKNVEVDTITAGAHPHLQPGHFAQLCVTDTGVGMERQVLERAFEPFFTTKPRGEGTGLGLSTAFGIVTQAGGSLELSSQPGIGTSCQILLPAASQPAARAESLSEGVTTVGGTVLLVEDEEAVRAAAIRILERAGYLVLSCSGGVEAIEWAAQYEQEIHLLLTDVIMPGVLGREVARRVQESRPGIAVLYMSGYAQPAFGGTLEQGTALVDKPFTENQLLAKVRALLDRRATD